MNITSICLLICFLSISTATVRYDNFALYRMFPKNTHDVSVLKNLQSSKLHNFWTYPAGIGKPVDILVNPENKDEFENFIGIHDIPFKVLMNNVQEKIDEETRVNSLNTRIGDTDDLTWDKYSSLEAINNWLQKLARDHPDKVTIVEAGRSYENRSILGVKVSFGSKSSRNTVWLDSQIHAREWISGATTTYILDAILHSDDPIIRKMAEKHDWYIFPVINPDGYEYTFTTDRFWRKTRTPYKGIFRTCYGADPNRNWDYKWNEGGSTTDACSDTYAGPRAFSEIECKTLSEFMASVADQLLLFITFHSYSQFILLPYGHTTEHLDNYNTTYPVGLKAAEALSQRYGTEYDVGNIAETIYVATGSNMDWLKGTYHVPFAYAYELRDTGEFGFILPTEQIIPTALETLDSIVAILEVADKLK